MADNYTLAVRLCVRLYVCMYVCGSTQAAVEEIEINAFAPTHVYNKQTKTIVVL